MLRRLAPKHHADHDAGFCQGPGMFGSMFDLIPSPVVTLVMFMVAGWVVLAVVGVLVCLPKRTHPIRLVNVGRDAALSVTHDVLWSAMDSRFGFPTGFFSVDVAESDAERVVAREQVFAGTDMKQMLLSAVEGPVNWGKRNNSAAGPIFGVVLMIVLLPVLAWAAVAEQLMRRMLRSTITAELSDLHEGFGTEISLVLRGPSARFAASRITAAFAEPRLPGRVNRKAARKAKEMAGA